MKKYLKSSMILACLATPAYGWASPEVSPYTKLNELLKVVHSNYLKKDFQKIEEVRPSFLIAFDEFNSLKSQGKVRLINQVQRDDFKLAQSYQSSLTTYYSALQKKYGYVPEVKKEVIAEVPKEETPKADIVKYLGLDKVPGKDMETNFTLSDELVKRSEEMRLNSFVSVAELIEDPENEEFLNHELLKPIDEKKWNKAFNEYYAKEYNKPLITDASDDLPPEIPEEAKLPPLPGEEEQLVKNPLQKSDFDRALEAARKKKITEVYKEESKIIEDGLKKIKVLKENQARFEIKQMDQNKDQIQEESDLPKSKKRPVYTHDRLSEDDDDIIIISFPRKK